MTDDRTDNPPQQQVEGVRLVSPGGDEVTVRNPEAVNNLVYGGGYRLADTADPEAAVRAAQEQQPDQTDTADGPAGTGTETQAPSAPTAAGSMRARGKAAPASRATPPGTT